MINHYITGIKKNWGVSVRIPSPIVSFHALLDEVLGKGSRLIECYQAQHPNQDESHVVQPVSSHIDIYFNNDKSKSWIDG
ncbi:hypothetical protein DRN72_02390 [Methanosarcinales archaeon]|nr:MAG: hypothetical protein DRN72_02390 [Methanosarcinales archaeon]